MKLIDTHAHLQFEKFDPDRDEVVKRTSENLEAVIMPGSKIDNSEAGVKLAQSVPNFYAAVGIHPHHDKDWEDSWVNELEKLVVQEKVVAVGEIGLDNYQYKDYPPADLKKQLSILLPQITLARKYKKPILFHCREAYAELYEAIKDLAPMKGLVHCFMGDKEVAKKFVDLGLLISFAGNLTYKGNEQMREAAAFLPEEVLLIETDSPYLSPEPKRGQRNEPENVRLVAATIAESRQTTLEAIATATVNNAQSLFQI